VDPTPRQRPSLHFTARHGWTNDPHGIIHLDGVYHLFFQHNPDGVAWSPRCHWGHATSIDLVNWRQEAIALSPADDEIGCWSGAVVTDERGPVIVYTSIAPGDPHRGRIALARPRDGMRDWVRDPPRPVIDGPPENLGVVAFRDPHVRRDGDRWKAVIGAGRSGSRGCALQYSSPDLESWTYDGILAEQPGGGWSPHTGAVWECPRLLQVGGDWVLIISAWDGAPGSVNYAIGDYDGEATFTPRTWGSFSHASRIYATTTFRDVEGRPCALSWLRERDDTPPPGSPWASAMSLPHVLSIEDGILIASQHPALESALANTASLGDIAAGEHLDAPLPGPVWRLRFTARDYSSGGFAAHAIGSDQSFAVEASGPLLTVRDEPGADLLSMPVSPAHSVDVDVVADADIIEITLSGTEGVAATRIPVLPRGKVSLSPAGGTSISGARLSTPS
jgi:beta-fructofuranosidase